MMLSAKVSNSELVDIRKITKQGYFQEFHLQTEPKIERETDQNVFF